MEDFKGTVDRLSDWAWPIFSAPNASERRLMKLKLLESIGEDLLEARPGRYEPRVLKRRPKPFPVMIRPRQEYHEKFAASQVS